MKRIALVTHSLSGGVWTVTRFLWDILSKNTRFSPEIIHIATSSRDPASVRLLDPTSWIHGVQIESGSKDGLLYRHVGATMVELEFQRYRSRRVLNQLLNEFDLIQIVAGSPAFANVVPSLSPPVALQVATLSRIERRRLLQTSSWPRRSYFKLMQPIVDRIENLGIRKASVVFVENRWMWEWAQKQVGKENAVFAPPGVDTIFFSPNSGEYQYQDAPYILSVGRFSDPRKNIRLLFDAYAIVQQRIHPYPKLVLAGRTSPIPTDMEYAANLGILEDIIIRQDVPLNELADLYRNAQVFVLSSDEEGLGIVLLEAMASGIPVISTDCGGPSTAVENGINGFLTRAGDAETMADALLLLLKNDGLRCQMGTAARQIAVERFSVEAAAKTYLNVYEELLFS